MIELSRLFRFSSTVLLAAVAAIAWGGRLSAQCPIPDGLDGGPCCALATENAPNSKITQDSLNICWNDCGIDFIGPVVATWTPQKILSTTGPDCGIRRNTLNIRTPGGMLLWTGTMRLQYSRTWLEMPPGGMPPLQVWRYLVNGNLRASALVAPPPCPLPPCAPAFGGSVKFTGYIDYARSCLPGGMTQVAWMLTHACDMIDHAPGFPRAGIFHPGRSYTFVGPMAGFVPAPVVATEGTPFSAFEAVRRLQFPAPGTAGPIQCEFEEPFSHALTVTPLCLCATGPTFSAQWVLGSLAGGGTCGTTIGTPGGPFLPGFLSMGIGSWTLGGIYPGMEDLRWNVGGYDYTDPCTGVVMPEVFYGVTTLGGYPAMQVTTMGPLMPLPLTFIDQSNSLGGIGTVMNIPYVSDHVLNLNE